VYVNDQQMFLIVASGCFGIFVGFVFRFFLEKFETYDVRTLSAALAVPVGGTLLVFVSDFGTNSRPAYTIGLVLGLVLYQAFYSKFPSLPMRHKRTGQVTLTESSDIVTILDAGGTRAIWVRTQTMKFNVGAREALIARLAGEGQILPGKLMSKGRVVDLSERKGHVYAVFAAEIKKGDVVDITLESSVKDAFPTNIEWVERDILQPTDKLKIEVRFPDERRCQAAELTRIFGADEEKIEQLVPGSSVIATIPKGMQVGESYRLHWQW
jgi:hypothetical protein